MNRKKINTYLTLALIPGCIIPLLLKMPILLFIPIFIGMILCYSHGEEKRETRISSKRQAKELLEKEHINPTQSFIDNKNLSVIAVDEEKETLIVLNRKDERSPFSSRQIPFSDLLEVKLAENGSVVTSASKGGMAAGALVGGLVGGGFGAVIGASGANRSSQTKVKELSLELVIDSLNDPVHKVTFMNELVEVKKEDERYKKAFEYANHWYRLCGVIVNRNEKQIENIR
ncbi:hypothetical protein [Domibacillus sp.]|uniref:hypothetical protein n=1 Tax=Domibacillus sp. TaxID=1969783 RepID=UPI0028111804|nr:hypothetical protein [Domibacillus sp.]